MKKLEYRIWNTDHELVLPDGNLREENWNFIFSAEEAEKKYPWSTYIEEYTRYSWDEYLHSWHTNAECYEEWVFAIVKTNTKTHNPNIITH